MMQTTGDRVTGGGGGTQRTDGAGVPKQRLYEVAKDIGLSNKDLVDKVRALGIEVKNHMSALEPDDVARVKRALEKERQENTVVERIQPTVIRRRNKNAPEEAAAPRAAAPVAPAQVAPVTRRRVEVETPAVEARHAPEPAPKAEAVRKVAEVEARHEEVKAAS